MLPNIVNISPAVRVQPKLGKMPFAARFAAPKLCLRGIPRRPF